VNRALRYTQSIVGAALWLCSTLALADVSVLMNRNDPAGDGANLSETILNPTSVASGSFGKLASLKVEGTVFAQPLIAAGISIAGSTRDVVYVATMANLVYAFDANNFTDSGGMLWQVRFSSAGASPVPFGEAGGQSAVYGQVGIMSTPVIDSSTNTIYVLSRVKLATKSYGNFLHALDLSTGVEKFNGPVEVSFTGANQYGSWSFNNAGTVGQRPSLTLVNNDVVVAFGTIPEPANRGWVMAFNKSTLSLEGAFCTSCSATLSGSCSIPVPPTPNSTPVGAGIWQSGRAPAVDTQGNVYVFTANGWSTGNGNPGSFPWACSVLTDTTAPPSYYFGESVVKLSAATLAQGSVLGLPTGSAVPLVNSGDPNDYWYSDDLNDQDVGSSGPVVISENGTIVMGGGKDGILRLFNASDLVGQTTGAAEIFDVDLPPAVPSCGTGTVPRQIMGGPVYWNRSALTGGPGSLVIIAPENEVMQSYTLSFLSGSPKLTLTSESVDEGSESWSVPGGVLSLSANGDTEGSGVVWEAVGQNKDCTDGQNDAVSVPVLATLRAYNADNLNTVLWTSDLNGARDSLGYLAKFVPPTVANGKVYMASLPAPDILPPGETCDICSAGQSYNGTDYSLIQVYGLNPPAVAPVLMNAAVAVAPMVMVEEDY
jgi:hypothetical protein